MIAVVLCDRAGWHQRGKELIVPDNIRLLSLPAYSPELNPMENVWDYLRQNKLCAQVWDTYDTYDEILEACKNAWNFLTDDPDRIRSIGARDWASVNHGADQRLPGKSRSHYGGTSCRRSIGCWTDDAGISARVVYVMPARFGCPFTAMPQGSCRRHSLSLLGRDRR